MFSKNDLLQMAKKGLEPLKVENQIRNYVNGFPFVNLVAPATPVHGILRLEESDIQRFATSYHAVVKGREILKFVPASGAASRMFKSLFEFLNEYKNKSGQIAFNDKGFNSPYNFFKNIRQFAFYEDLENKLAKDGHSVSELIELEKYDLILECFLGERGLNYASLPKGLLKFHRYQHEDSRTAIEEHLVEAAHYACDSKGISSVHFTVSPEHMDGFRELVSAVAGKYEQRFGVKYEVSYSVQKPSTDMIAVDMNNEPFREADGSLLFRPGGHGALIENMNDLHGDIVFVKNIDNVVPDRLKEQTYLYKQALGAMLTELQSIIFGMLIALDNADISPARVEEIAAFCNESLNIRLADDFKGLPLSEKVEILRKKLNRPIRVCGMVKNEGEPGGGPFWVRDASGNVSLQIVESSQINLSDEKQKQVMQASTHFNPVDLVCGLKNYKGKNFHLPDFVDHETGFISGKSKDGRKLKAQELPGLWNGAMADWISIFIEVPIITFNPVKVINDLLRKEHLAD